MRWGYGSGRSSSRDREEGVGMVGLITSKKESEID